MQHDQMIGQIQHRARLASRGDAERAVRATLETLGERLPEGLVDNLASQLPQEIGEHLRRTEVLGGLASGERFDRDEFVARVSERAGTDPPYSVFLVRVVFEMLDEATQGKIMQHIRESLPPDLRPMAKAGSLGEIRD
jgi:uncharacterized protein (DUF2267 family)